MCIIYLYHVFPLAPIKRYLIRWNLCLSPWIDALNDNYNWYACLKICSFTYDFCKNCLMHCLGALNFYVYASADIYSRTLFFLKSFHTYYTYVRLFIYMRRSVFIQATLFRKFFTCKTNIKYFICLCHMLDFQMIFSWKTSV